MNSVANRNWHLLKTSLPVKKMSAISREFETEIVIFSAQ